MQKMDGRKVIRRYEKEKYLKPKENITVSWASSVWNA